MIQELINILIDHLRTGLTGEVGDVNAAVQPGPVGSPAAASRPVWAVEAADLRSLASPPDDSSAQARPLEARERILVNGGNPAGPYPLGSQPLEGSVEIRAVYDEGLVTEYSETLLPGVDFTVDVAGSEFTVDKDISEAEVLRVKYSFVGIATIQEFEQNLFIRVYCDGLTDIDRYLGLPVSIVQSRHAEIVEQFNFLQPTNITANSFMVQPMIQKLRFADMVPLPRAENQALSDVVWQLNFTVRGQMRLGQTISGGFGIITNIHSPGSFTPGIDIRPDLG